MTVRIGVIEIVLVIGRVQIRAAFRPDTFINLCDTCVTGASNPSEGVFIREGRAVTESNQTGGVIERGSQEVARKCVSFMVQICGERADRLFVGVFVI